MRNLTSDAINCPDCDGTFGNQNPACPVDMDIAQTVDRDRAYLKEHPEVDVYDRPTSWGELQELDATGAIPDDWGRDAEEYSGRSLMVAVVRNGSEFGRLFAWRYTK